MRGRLQELEGFGQYCTFVSGVVDEECKALIFQMEVLASDARYLLRIWASVLRRIRKLTNFVLQPHLHVEDLQPWRQII